MVSMDRFKKSGELYKETANYIPAGTSSNLRAFPTFDPYPIFLRRANGSHVWDADGNEMIDLLGAFGAAILGHLHPRVIDGVKKQLDEATMLGTPTELEMKTAKLFCELVPYADQVRFGNTGTESTMHAIRIARAYTGKNKIIKFEGHYHGTHDYVSVSVGSTAGSDIAPYKVPNTPGIPEETLKTVIVLPWNNLEVVEKTIKRQGQDIAGILMEPIMCNGGLVFPEKGYLEGVRQLCTDNDIVLIFDEVVTGFRMALGGASEYLGVKPDLGTFAKAMAGGVPCAAIAGKREIMSIIKPGGVMHAGTYNANLVSLSGAYATMTELKSQGKTGYDRFHRLGKKLIKGLKDAAAEAHQKVFLPGFTGWFLMYFTEKTEFKNFRNVNTGIDFAKFSKFAWEMMRRDIYVHPDALERINLSFAHTEEDVEKILEAASEAFRAI
jgi:glutamate-1-semialdehyde 2,1-aminomutase